MSFKRQPIKKPVHCSDIVTSLLPAGMGSVIRLRKDWSLLVGKSMAEHSTPLRLLGGKLYVSVDHSVWSSQFQYLRSALIHKINQGNYGIKLEFILMRVGTIPKELPRTAPQRNLEISATLEGLSKPIINHIETSVAPLRIKDPELAACIRRMMIRHYKRVFGIYNERIQ